MSRGTARTPSSVFILRLLCLLWLIQFIASPVGAQVIQLTRPGQRDFIVDKADLVTPEDEQRIKQICDKLLTDTACPIIVVTVESMAASLKPGRELPWETFARVLFDEWGIGNLTQGNPPNSGILLLVSRDDRKARIELGTGWTIERDQDVQDIMQRELIPNFKRGDYSQGILAGVQALDRMARQPRGGANGGGGMFGGGGAANPGTPADVGSNRGSGASTGSPRGSGSSSSPANGLGGLLGGCGGFGTILLIIAVMVIMRGLGRGLGGQSVRRSRGWYGGLYPGMWYGSGGMGGGMGGGFGGMGGGSRGGGFSSGGGGGFSGGSFGGGFSGGRGASGSW